MANHHRPPAHATHFGFSANRGRARHRVRYVEQGGALSEECRLCQDTLAPSAEAPARPSGKQDLTDID